MIRVVGMGMGVAQLTGEAVAALRACDYVVAASKRADDGLLALRREVCEAYDVELVVVPDPERDRVSTGSTDEAGRYAEAVRDWHAARVEAYREVIEQRGGTAGFLVWGDPALYDSTIRVVSAITADFDVVPGISAPQLLAARHRIVLHEVGQPVHVTTARRLRDDIGQGQRNLVVFLTGALDLHGLDSWRIWWGANLGTPSERLVSGLVADVMPQVLAARAEAKERAGWMMDLYLLRAPA